jgi:hypothetical protein
MLSVGLAALYGAVRQLDAGDRRIGATPHE